MDIEQIEILAKQGESQCLEFKKSTANLKDTFQTICAFLNGKGGVVLLGIKNDGYIIGQDVTDNTRQEIAREIKKFEPTPEIIVTYIPTINSKFVIAIEVTANHCAPYTYDGRAFERTESSTGQMSQHKYEQLIIRRGQMNHSWEEHPADGYDINSLDHEEIRRTIKEGIDQNRISVEVLNYDIAHILKKLKLFNDDKVTNAAVVLYAREFSSKYSNCMIRLARFKGTDKLSGFIDNQRVEGNAFRLLSAASDFTQRHLPIASFFESGNMKRIDQPAVPALALREALINAISHRNYENRSSSIALAIYDDRLEVWNNGELPPELTLEDLRKQHQSYPRNEEIATIFYKRGWVEGWGTGTLGMIRYCQQNRTPEPEFQEYSGGFSVVFRFKEPMNTIKKELDYLLTIRQEEILKILSSGNKMAIKDIASLLKEPPASRTLRDDLGKLRKLGLISLEGKAKTAKWFIKKG